MSAETLGGGRYVIERPLAEGGMADVYLARDLELERPVAVKALSPALARDAGLRERFVREARMAAALQHPNVVTVFDTGEHEGRPFIVMEFVEGVTLADRLRTERRLPPAEVVALALQVCAGLEHAHAAGLVHRDVKPGNLLLREDGTAKVADFGIASAAAMTRLTDAGTILGTAAYLAPEQAAGEPVTPAADVYSLGAVLYEALTGEPPFRFRSLPELVTKQQAGAIRPIGELAPEVPEPLAAVVMRCLSVDPTARPASAAELAIELEGGLAGEPRSAGPRTAATRVLPRPARPARRPRSLLPVALVALLAIGAVVAALAFAADDGDGTDEPPPVEPVPQAEAPAGQARNLADWLRENAEEPAAR